MIHFEKNITVTDALLVTLISLAVVFTVLIVIALIVSALGKVLKEEKPVAATTKPVATKASPRTTVTASPVKAVNLSEVMNDEHKRIATLVATMAANENDEDKKYRVVSIREI